jgi:hypothetical protein
MRQILFLHILIYFSTLCNIKAQNAKVIYPHTVFWSKTEINEIFKNKLGLGLDFVYRRKSDLDNKNMFSLPLRESIRPWVHYQFSPYARFSLSPIGYMHTNEYIGKPQDYNRLPYHELRTTFQFYHHLKQWGGRIMHTWRYRYELRWQENPITENYRFFSRFRLRYRIRLLLNTNDFYENKVVYLAVSNEIGLNIGKSIVYNHFNQNRLYVGAGIRLFEALRIELRYVDRYRTRGATGFEYDHGKGLMIGLYVDQISALGKKGTDQSVRFVD